MIITVATGSHRFVCGVRLFRGLQGVGEPVRQSLSDELIHHVPCPRALVVDCLTEYLGPRAGSPDAYLELDWSAERWTRGCYGAHFTPGGWTQFGQILREPVGRIHWAGTETSSTWNGYMEGAVRSGERAANEVLGAKA